MAPQRSETRPTGNPDLYPPLIPHRSGWLAVGDGHHVWWEESGTPDGLPVLFVHGGPGAGTAGVHRSYFDPERYRIVLFDQRGCGRSTPVAATEANTTAHLIADMEALRAHLEIGQWLLFGGSWGSTLALAYGQAHPERCLGFILRGVFLFRARERAWFLDGMGTFFPEAAEAFRAFLPEEERNQPVAAYLARLCDPDPTVHMPAAVAWCRYEEACSALVPSAVSRVIPAPETLAMARLEAHYFAHDGFLRENQLLEDLPRLRHLPAWIVQGRYDVVCPPVTACELAAHWPRARLTLVPDAGHSGLEPGTRQHLVRATCEALTLVTDSSVHDS